MVVQSTKGCQWCGALVAGLSDQAALLLVAVGCGQERADPPEGVNAAAEGEGELASEFSVEGELPELPTHWTNDRPIESLNPDTVARLQVAWVFPTGTFGQFEASPVVDDGLMYVTSAHNRVFALDARTGELYRRYDHPLPDDLRLCCGPPNRGVGIWGNVVTGTQNGHALALDSATGEVLWKFRVGGGVRSQPIALQLDGETYVAVPAGNWASLAAFQGANTMIPEGGSVFVFRLPSGS